MHFRKVLPLSYVLVKHSSKYEAGQTHSVISEQLTVLQTLVETGELNQSRFIIAYEPVWAIGTGKVPTPAEVENVHAFIQSQLTNIHHTLHHTPILYGGSVKADNAKDIAQCPTVSGFWSVVPL